MASGYGPPRSRAYASRFNPYGGFLDEKHDSLSRKYDRPRYLDDPAGGSDKALSETGSFAWSKQVYPRFAVPGWGHLLLGMCTVIVGATDIGWTAAKYEDSCDYTTTVNFDPCDTNNVFTYISSPLWGGLLMLLNGLCTFWMSPLRLSTNSWLLYVFVGLSLLLILPICPAIIVLNILELTENEGKFWADVSGEGTQIASGNTVKFALPIVLIVLGFIDMLVAVAAVLVGCCFPPDLTERLMYPGVEKYLASLQGGHGPPRSRPGDVMSRHSRQRSRAGDLMSRPRSRNGDVIVSEEVVRPSGSRSYAGQAYARSDYYARSRPRSRNGDVVVSEERVRPARSDRSGYSGAYSGFNFPPLGRSYAQSEDLYGRGGRPRSRNGDVIVHEERIRPGGSRAGRY